MLDWSVVIPVKRLGIAKSRLRGALPAGDHQRLVLALCLDTVCAVLDCAGVTRVLAVTDDHAAARALRAAGVIVVPDLPDRGLSPAVEYGAAVAAELAPDAGIAVLSADLPALRFAELASALDAASRHPRAFVADAAATGTTLLTASPGHPLLAAYGMNSCVAHAATGAVELAGDWPSLRRDVDTANDLHAAATLGLGAHTAAVLAQHNRNAGS